MVIPFFLSNAGTTAYFVLGLIAGFFFAEGVSHCEVSCEARDTGARKVIAFLRLGLYPIRSRALLNIPCVTVLFIPYCIVSP